MSPSAYILSLFVLQYIHSKGITHRELKPEVFSFSIFSAIIWSECCQKILLTKDRPPRVKVAFGLSKFYDRAIMPQVRLISLL